MTNKSGITSPSGKDKIIQITKDDGGYEFEVRRHYGEDEIGALTIHIDDDPRYPHKKKTCTHQEALELRNALIELFPLNVDEEEEPEVGFFIHLSTEGKYEVWETLADGGHELRGEFWDEHDARQWRDELTLDKYIEVHGTSIDITEDAKVLTRLDAAPVKEDIGNEKVLGGWQQYHGHYDT